MPFGQVVIGPPGSGKTTYCRAMQEFLRALGRNVAVVNLDPANESLPYEADVDMSHLVQLEEVMEKLKLGPNGALVYCMELLAQNSAWLEQQLESHKAKYFLFDFPGQVELYTHHDAVSNVLQQLAKKDFQLVTVHLVDAHYCSDPGKFISVLLTSLSTMLKIALPHVNVLSKIDLVEQFGKLAFGLDYFTEVLDLSYLLEHLSDSPFMRRYKDLNERLVSLVEDHGLVSFSTLNVQDKESMSQVLRAVDKAVGYVFGEGESRNLAAMMSSAMSEDYAFFKTADVREKHTSAGRCTAPLDVSSN